MNYYHLTQISANKKTGPIAVSTRPKKTCPPECPLINDGCFAASGPLNLHWLKVSDNNRGA